MQALNALTSAAAFAVTLVCKSCNTPITRRGHGCQERLRCSMISLSRPPWHPKQKFCAKSGELQPESQQQRHKCMEIFSQASAAQFRTDTDRHCHTCSSCEIPQRHSNNSQHPTHPGSKDANACKPARLPNTYTTSSGLLGELEFLGEWVHASACNTPQIGSHLSSHKKLTSVQTARIPK